MYIICIHNMINKQQRTFTLFYNVGYNPSFFVSSLSPEDASLSRSKSAISTNSPSVIFLTSLHALGGSLSQEVHCQYRCCPLRKCVVVSDDRGWCLRSSGLPRDEAHLCLVGRRPLSNGRDIGAISIH